MREMSDESGLSMGVGSNWWWSRMIGGGVRGMTADLVVKFNRID